MTVKTTKPELAPDQLAQVASVLEQLLPHGYSLTHTKRMWYAKKWDSWFYTTGPRMSWRDVDSDKSLAALLQRLGEHS